MNKYIFTGEHHRHNGWVMRDALAYMADSLHEAITTCQQNQPQFQIHTIIKE